MHQPVHVTARFKVKAGCIGEMLELLATLAANTRQEPGCRHYHYYQSIDDSTVFTSFEIWVDAESEAAHWQTQLLKEVVSKVPALTDGPVETTRYRCVV
ncbi:MAG: antibiotic biosynthesis monooxygenase [Oceanospirillaceae bacterium]|nr:antibiotic biosynthesis monooxygenase [Oceanospirillaceae bacterium]